VWILTPLFPSRDRSALTGSKTSAVAGTTTIFTALSWAVSLQGKDARSHARKALMSSIPERKMGFYSCAPLRGEWR
jgi:hypothetical protein